jgi:8-oxo-dGTP diphosphatase
MKPSHTEDWPRVGVGCIIIQADRFLLVKSTHGYWSTPGGNLEQGESPTECAVREALEETGLQVTNVRFVAITSDVVNDTGRHYITIWMRGDAADSTAIIGDPAEIAEVGWFRHSEFPAPRFSYFDNLLAGRCLPSPPLGLGDVPGIGALNSRDDG